MILWKQRNWWTESETNTELLKNVWHSDSLTGNKYAKLHSTISNDILSLRFAVLSHNITGSQKVFKPVQFPDNNNGCFFCTNPQKFYANCHAKNTIKWWGGGTNLRKDHKAARVNHSEPPLDQHMLFFTRKCSPCIGTLYFHARSNSVTASVQQHVTMTTKHSHVWFFEPSTNQKIIHFKQRNPWNGWENHQTTSY